MMLLNSTRVKLTKKILLVSGGDLIIYEEACPRDNGGKFWSVDL